MVLFVAVAYRQHQVLLLVVGLSQQKLANKLIYSCEYAWVLETTVRNIPVVDILLDAPNAVA
jgi:hypothetical protein